MLPEADRVRLLHMRDAICEARRFVEGRKREDLDCDSMLLRALVNCLEMAGEAGSRVSAFTQARLEWIPWRLIVGMRNRLVHAYFDIDRDVVWATVRDDLPRLQAALDKALEGEGQDV